MAGEWFKGLGQFAVGCAGIVVTLGQVDAIHDWTDDGGNKMDSSLEETWGKDGDVTKFAESLPGVGHIVSVGHLINNDEQRAWRATARSNTSTLVTVGSAVGFMVGGPLGAAAGAAAGSAAGQSAEIGINHSITEEHRTKAGTFKDFKVEKFTKDVILDGTLSGISAGVACTLGKKVSRAVMGRSVRRAGKVVVRRPGRYVMKKGVKAAVSKTATAISKPVVKKIIRHKH